VPFAASPGVLRMGNELARSRPASAGVATGGEACPQADAPTAAAAVWRNVRRRIRPNVTRVNAAATWYPGTGRQVTRTSSGHVAKMNSVTMESAS